MYGFTRFPDAIDKGENFLNSEEGKFLANEIPYTNYRLEGKEVVTNILNKDAIFQKYVIPYSIANEATQFLNFIQLHKSIVIKPVLGSSGKEILNITLQDDAYRILSDEDTLIMEQSELLLFLDKRMRSRKHIAQKMK